jgi:uncharacterized protein (TIGR03790 family)
MNPAIIDRSPKVNLLTTLAMFFIWPFLFPSTSQALVAGELLVVANPNVHGSVGLAKYYMAKREVPAQNLLRVFVTDEETCSREDYDQLIARPIREKLAEYSLAKRPRCLVTVKGVPLRIGDSPFDKDQQAAIDGLKAERKRLNGQLNQILDEAEKKQAEDALAMAKEKIAAFERKHNTGASVDSELMLVQARQYPLAMWMPNPFFLGFQDNKLALAKKEAIMVSRLDAPTAKMVRRMIDDAVAAEKNGLTGTAYFDARYNDPGDKPVSGYGLYDKSIRLAAERIRAKEVMPVVLEGTGELFQPGECPTAALYCGWYSLARYVDAFEWVPGAVGYHIASSECTTLRQGNSQVWCKRMLEEGAAVTIGPVDEPYVQAFPLPDLFFRALSEGMLTVAESYLLSVPYLSWKMVLLGDPLYRPFE